jgi:ankyrin repeat protein
LESSGVSIDILDKSGMTALHWAVLKSREGTKITFQIYMKIMKCLLSTVCARLLLEYGADPDRRQRGDTVIYFRRDNIR